MQMTQKAQNIADKLKIKVCETLHFLRYLCPVIQTFKTSPFVFSGYLS